MIRLGWVTIFCLILPEVVNASSRSFSKQFEFRPATGEFDLTTFEVLVDESKAEPQNYLHEFREYSYPEERFEARLYCDSLRNSARPEDIAHVDQERVDLAVHPHGKWPWVKSPSVEEYLLKTPRFVSALAVPSFVNQQCSVLLSWSKKDPIVKARWMHWNAMNHAAEVQFRNTMHAQTRRIEAILIQASRRKVVSSVVEGMAETWPKY